MRPIMFLLLLACACASTPPPAPVATPAQPPPQPLSLPPLIDPPWDMPDLFRALNAQRSAAGAAPLRIDRGLCAVAERAQSEYQQLGRGAEQRVLGLLNQDLQGFGLSFERTLAAVVVVEEVREAPTLLSAALDPSMAYAGLVVGPAPPPVGPRGGYSVVLALGQ
jgi:hypothetical protein